MNNYIKYSLLFSIVGLIALSCSDARGNGNFTMILSGSVHGQLDPCG